MSILKSLPFQLILSIFTAFILGGILDGHLVAIFYTASSCFIDLLLFLLPFMVFGFIFCAVSETNQRSLRLILLIFATLFASNLCALFASYFFSQLCLPQIGVGALPEFLTHFHSSIEPLFRLQLPALLSTDKAMLAAALLGMLIKKESGGKLKKSALLMHQTIGALNKGISWFLHRLIIPLLPLYVFGFCLKLSFDQALPMLFKAYGKVFLLSLLLLFGYIGSLYLLAAKGNWKLALNNIKKMLPAGLTGFSTMSSAATLPVTLKCTEQTTQNRTLTHLIIPTTSNIHMLGDDLTIVMASMALLVMFGLPLPDLPTFALFAAAFCVAKLSCVGVPGASVLVVLPVVQNYLGFSPEMIAVLTTIYILQDPIGTSANVMGNGAFALFFQRLYEKQEQDTQEDSVPS